MHAHPARITAALALAALAGCDLTFPWTDTPEAPGASGEVTVTLSGSAVTLQTLPGLGAGPGEVVTVTVSGQAAAGLGLEAPDGVPPWLHIADGGTGTRSVELTFSVAAAPPVPGTYPVALRIVALDATDRVLASAPLTVTLEVAPRPTASPLSLSWIQAHRPPETTISIARDPRVTLGETQVDVPWLSVSRTGDAVTIGSNEASATRPPGIHAAVVSVVYAFGAGAGVLEVPVTAEVERALDGPAGLTFQIDAETTAQDVTQAMTITSPMGTGLEFTASADVPWLSVTGGATGAEGNLAVAVVPSALETLENGEHGAVLTVMPAGGGYEPLQIPVTLSLSLPDVWFVGPVAYSDDATDHVIVRGVGFAAPGVGLSVNGAPVTEGVTVVDDTELRFVPGARAPGAYALAASNALGVPRPSVSLHVVDRPAYVGGTVEAAFGDVEQVVVSARHSAVFAVKCCTFGSGTPSRLIRYQWDGTSGNWAATAHDYPELWDAALTPGEDHLAVLTSAALLLVNPATLETEQTIPLPQVGVARTRDLAVTSDGVLLLASLHQGWSLRTAEWVDAPWLSNGEGNLAGSQDGDLILTGFADNGGTRPVWSYDATTGTAEATASRAYFARAAVSRHGERALVSNVVLDAQLGPLYTIGFTGDSGTISPSGRRAYGWTAPNLSRFDLTATTPPATELPPLTVSAPGGISRVACDPSGDFVFVVGEQRMVVVDVRE